jgi:PKD repeat protein
MVSDLPVGATLNPNTGEFSWMPGSGDGGTYSATFTASDGRLNSNSEAISILTLVPNNPPVANAGGPYAGAVGQPIQFSSAGSHPGDAGQTLTYAWSFGDGGTSTSADPQHTYAVEGNYIATLVVTDDGMPALSATAVAGVLVQVEITCDVFIKNDATSIRAHGGGRLKLAIQQTDRSYTDIDPNSLRMHTTYPNAGSVAEIAALPKSLVIGDLNLDSVQDLIMQFNTSDVADLFSNTPNNTSVEIVITGVFLTPTGSIPLRGTKTVTVKTGGGGGLVSASAFPNPFNPQTVISYSTKKDGAVSVRIFSIDGRLVRTLKDGEFTSAGTHEVRWDGTDNLGRPAVSSVYFVQSVLRTGSGTERSIMKISLMK